MLTFCGTMDETQSLEHNRQAFFLFSFLLFDTKDGIISDSTLNNSKSSLKTKWMNCHRKILVGMIGKLKIQSPLTGFAVKMRIRCKHRYVRRH